METCAAIQLNRMKAQIDSPFEYGEKGEQSQTSSDSGNSNPAQHERCVRRADVGCENVQVRRRGDEADPT